MQKRYATLLIILGTILFSSFANAQDFSKEQFDAYYYARSLGITTTQNIYMADMYGKLTRAHMAKMMVNYAKNVLGKTPDINIPCGFLDITNQSKELQEYIIEACQMGLMGIRADGMSDNYFYPERIVTRAEFGTVLSRVLRGNLFDGATPFYTNHFFALKHAGIMKEVTKPNIHELRGWVMVMLMRVEKGEEKTELACDTPENIFYCDVARTMGVELCPPECVMMSSMNAGTLEVKPFIQANYQSKESGGTYIASLRMETRDIPVKITTIVFRLGEQRPANVTLRLESNEKRITRKTRPNSEGVVTIALTDTMIKKASSERVHLVASTDIPKIMIEQTDDIQSSALFLMGTYPIVIR